MKPKDDKSMKGASSTQKREKAPAVDRSRSVVSTRFRVDEGSGSGEHGSRPHTSEHCVEPVQILYLLPLSSSGQVTFPKSLLAQESESFECLINRTVKTRGFP